MVWFGLATSMLLLFHSINMYICMCHYYIQQRAVQLQ